MIELTEQQQQALDMNSSPRLVDPRTQKAYVLIDADVFDRFRGLLDSRLRRHPFHDGWTRLPEPRCLSRQWRPARVDSGTFVG